LEAPRIPSFFKSQNPKPFGFRPRFYDADKEERERRNRLIKAELRASVENPKAHFESKMRERWHRSNSRVQHRSRSNFRLILIITALILVTYLILK